MNDTVITGAAIGFLVWAAHTVLNIGKAAPGSKFDWPKSRMLCLIEVGSGAAIGWLVS